MKFMKRAGAGLLACLLVFGGAACSAPAGSATPGASATASSPPQAEKPVPGTDFIIAGAEGMKDFRLQGGSGEDNSQYAESAPGLLVSAAEKEQVLLAPEARAQAALAAAGQFKYLRVWVCAPTEGRLYIGFLLSGKEGSAYLNPADAETTLANGRQERLSLSNALGVNKAAVLIPSGYMGWVAVPLSAGLMAKEGSLADVAAATGISVHVALQKPEEAEGKQYVIDDLTLANSASGVLSAKQGPLSAKQVQKKEELNTMLTSFLAVTPKVTEYPDYNPDSHPGTDQNDWANIRAITYEGAEIGGKKTKAFAYIGYPENREAGKKYPAIVLLHGGGGHAFAEWVKLWTDRGYVALAMDNTGFFPSAAGKGVAGREADYDKNYWQHGLYGDFAEAGYANVPQCDNMNSSAKDIDTQWMYHAVAQTILAGNLLRADEYVDGDKIGLTGISWGGTISPIAMVYDTRWAFAIPVYGSAYLDASLGWMGPIFNNADTRALWSSAPLLNKVTYPVLWLGWTLDTPFSIQSNSMSYMATRQNSLLSMLPTLLHGHSVAWHAKESYRFADSVVKEGAGFAAPVTDPAGERSLSFEITRPADATNVTARICYITEKMSYKNNNDIEQTFQYKPCTVSGTTVTGTVPDAAYSYYVEITTVTPEGSFVITTAYV